MVLSHLLWIITFGVVGVSSRFAVDTFFSRWEFSFPLHTLLINVLGCFIAGIIVNLGGSGKLLTESPIRLALIVGFCGGFTTFSGFGIQLVQMFQAGRVIPALTYGVGTNILCVLATALGFFLTKQS